MIRIAETNKDIMECFSLLSQLRPHLSSEDFLLRISRLSESTGYKLAYLIESEIVAVVGFRISEWLHTGKYLEIEELITKESERSKGFGSKLFDWILKYAKENECKQVRLVSGVLRNKAHNFYLRKGMVFEAKYFSIGV